MNIKESLDKLQEFLNRDGGGFLSDSHNSEPKNTLEEGGTVITLDTPHDDKNGNSIFMEAIALGYADTVKYFLNKIALCGSDEAVSEAEKALEAESDRKIGAVNILRKNNSNEDAFAIALKHCPKMAGEIAQKQLEAGKTRTELLRDIKIVQEQLEAEKTRTELTKDIEDSNIKCQDLKEKLQKAEYTNKCAFSVTTFGSSAISGTAAAWFPIVCAGPFGAAVYTLTTAAAVAGLSYCMFTWRDSIENDLNEALLEMSEEQNREAEI
jgi:hypothetical protein